MEQNFRKKVLVNTGIILSAFAIAAVLFSVLGGRLDAASAKIAADRNEAASRTYALENLSMLKTQEPEAAKYKEKLDTLLPNQDGLFSFITYLQGIAKLHQVDISFSYSGPAVAPVVGRPGYIPFTATLAGSSENIIAFIDDMESKSARFMVNFDTAELSGDRGSTYNATVKGKVFFK